MRESKNLPEVVIEAVDRSAGAAERLHKSVLRLPFDVLRRADLMGPTVRDVERLQEHSISAVYDLVRGINHEVGRLMESLTGVGGASAPAPRRSRPRKARKAAAAA